MTPSSIFSKQPGEPKPWAHRQTAERTCLQERISDLTQAVLHTTHVGEHDHTDLAEAVRHVAYWEKGDPSSWDEHGLIEQAKTCENSTCQTARSKRSDDKFHIHIINLTMRSLGEKNDQLSAEELSTLRIMDSLLRWAGYDNLGSSEGKPEAAAKAMLGSPTDVRPKDVTAYFREGTGGSPDSIPGSTLSYIIPLADRDIPPGLDGVRPTFEAAEEAAAAQSADGWTAIGPDHAQEVSTCSGL